MTLNPLFCVAFDAILAALENYSASVPEDERYTVQPDRYRTTDNLENGQYVFLYMGGIVPELSSTTHYQTLGVDYIVDMIAVASGNSPQRLSADRRAGEKLRYLTAQVLEALLPLGVRRLGMDSGTIGTMKFRSEAFIPEGQRGEKSMSSARLIFSVTVPWTPQPDTGGVPIQKITATAPLWSTEYDVS